MRFLYFCVLAIGTVTLMGCTEMRVEGDAKVFQSSAIGKLIQTVIGIALLGVGGVAVAGGVMQDKKPKKRKAKPSEQLSSGQRVGMIVFGGSMAFMGLFLAGASLVFPKKLHVTVYPDRVSMASTYSQTGGKELVIPFAGLASVELRDERNIVGKLKPYLVFTQHDGNVIRQEAGNNEKKAIDTIQQAFADFKSSTPAIPGGNPAVESASTDSQTNFAQRPFGSPPMPVAPEPSSTAPTTASEPVAAPADSLVPPTGPPVAGGDPASPSPQFDFKRYEISIPIPAGYSIVGADTPVIVGIKLKACYAGSWSTVTIVAINNDGTLSCNWDSYPSFTYRMARQDLIIGVPNGTSPPSEVPSKQYFLKRYPINIPVAKGYVVVGENTDVRVGMKLGACYAGRWEPVTVVVVNDDGTLTCNWDNYTAFTYKMMREDLTISKREAR